MKSLHKRLNQLNREYFRFSDWRVEKYVPEIKARFSSDEQVLSFWIDSCGSYSTLYNNTHPLDNE